MKANDADHRRARDFDWTAERDAVLWIGLLTMRKHLICLDKTIITVTRHGLEIRGDNWGRRKRGGPPNQDVVVKVSGGMKLAKELKRQLDENALAKSSR